MHLNVTRATSPSDYNRFYNQAYSYTAANGSCPQTDFEQDFQQCNGLACQSTTSGGGCSCPSQDPACYYPPNPPCGSSPIILDVDGKGFFLTNINDGIKFDIYGTGHLIQMGWTALGSSNAFLALPGVDGLVHNGTQLFGNHTPQPTSSTPNGFSALGVYDDPANGGNGDGIIDARDAVFASLRLWVDANHDGISQPEELHTLPSLGVTSISLNYKESRKTDQFGNGFRYRARVNGGDLGRTAYDVFFVIPIPTTAKNSTPIVIIPATQKCPVPTKVGLLSTTGTLR